MAVPGIRLHIKQTRDVEALLKKLPIEVREIGLNKAMRNAATIFAKEVRRKAGNLDGSSYDRPAWGSNVTPGALSKGITSPRRHKKDVPKHIIQVRVTTKDKANTYAAMAEYGHEKYIFGHKYAGQNDKKTPPVGFWRSSKDETESSVDRRIKEILKQEITRIINA
jgi:hypothetical protein